MNRIQLTATLIAILQLFFVSNAHAENKSGWAVNAGIGGSVIKDRDGDESFQGNGFGYILGAEYRFGQRWALGLDFFSLGTGSDTFNSVDTEIDVGGFDIGGRIIFPVSEKVEFYGRLGFAGYFADVDPGGSNLGEDAVSFGLGLDLGRNEHMIFRIEARYFKGPRDETGALVTAGINYRF